MNINDASRDELERVAQLDGERAEYLIGFRDKAGRFESWEDVKRVPSFDDGMVERLQSAGFTVGGSGRESRSRADTTTGRTASSGSEARGRSGDTATHSLNNASARDLEQTHMIDGERAQRLVDYREQHGRFSDWEHVKDVSGIDDGIVARLKESGFGLE